MLVITGPGRSGTSVLAQFCQSLGYDPGGDWCDAVDAGLEYPPVVRINYALYCEACTTGNTRAALEKYRDEMCAINLDVVKDPQFTHHPAVLRAWLEVRPDITLLLTYRNPKQSIASRNRHKRYLFVKHKERQEALKCDMADTIETLLELEVPYAILLFPNFLNQYDRVYTALTDLGLKFDREVGRVKWAALVDESRVHFTKQMSEKDQRRAQNTGPSLLHRIAAKLRL